MQWLWSSTGFHFNGFDLISDDAEILEWITQLFLMLVIIFSGKAFNLNGCKNNLMEEAGLLNFEDPNDASWCFHHSLVIFPFFYENQAACRLLSKL